MRPLVAILMLSLAAFAFGQSAPRPAVRFINPPTLSTPTGYTHVVEARGGRTLYISGQVALDSSGNVVGKGDFAVQATQVFENLKAALQAGGASLGDVAKMNMYVVDMSNVQALREIRAKYFTGSPPASTLVEVSRLAREEFLLEIEVIAVLPE